MARRYWLAELQIAGRVYRVADAAVAVTDAAGQTYEYADGLVVPQVAYASTVGVDDAAIGLTIDVDEDWAQIVAYGHALQGQPATLQVHKQRLTDL
jgi:hypothetical protein